MLKKVKDFFKLAVKKIIKDIRTRTFWLSVVRNVVITLVGWMIAKLMWISGAHILPIVIMHLGLPPLV